MKRTFILLGAFVLLGGVSRSYGQSALNATGGTNTVGGTEYDWSVGEVALVSTFYNPKIIVTQGLLQNELSTPQRASNIDFGSHLQIFPNPASSIVNLQYNAASAGVLNFRLMDMTGKVLMTHSLEVKQGMTSDQVNIGNLANATYMLEVNFKDNNDAAATASFKIEKLN